MLDEHLGYVADARRLDAYREAIARTLAPGERVADLGCGSGVLGLLCLQAGASHVVAIDETAMIEVARRTMTRAGFADRCTFVHGHSQRVALDAPVDVAICDHVGYFGFDYGIGAMMDDARRRFLAAGGRTIPRNIGLELAAVEAPMARAKVDDWASERVPAAFHWLRAHAANEKRPVDLAREAVLGPPARLGTIDLQDAIPPFFRWSATLAIERDAMLHGLAGWFDCELAPGVSMTNSPLSDRAIDRSQAFLPIDEPEPVRAGDLVRASVLVRPDEHLIAWNLELPSGRRTSQSNWPGMPSLPSDLVRSRPGHVPTLTRDARAAAIVLGFCDGVRTVREIEQSVLREHPDLLPSRDETLRFIARVLGRSSE